MATNNDPWNPETPVSFPDSYDYANVRIIFEHDSGICFGIARWRLPGYPPFAPGDKGTSDIEVAGHFIQANTALDDGWFRVSKCDFEMLLRRCKAERESQLYVTWMGGSRASVVFRPADFDGSAYMSSVVVEPMEDETAIWLRVLEHREVGMPLPELDADEHAA